MNSFDKTQRQAEMTTEALKTETWFDPVDNLFGEPRDFKEVEVEIKNGHPQSCYCGMFQAPNPNSLEVGECDYCSQKELF